MRGELNSSAWILGLDSQADVLTKQGVAENIVMWKLMIRIEICVKRVGWETRKGETRQRQNSCVRKFVLNEEKKNLP